MVSEVIRESFLNTGVSLENLELTTEFGRLNFEDVGPGNLVPEILEPSETGSLKDKEFQVSIFTLDVAITLH